MSYRISCIIIDDELIARKALSDYIKKVAELSLISTFSNGLEAKEWLSKNDIDLIFLDIDMPIINGLEFLRLFKDSPPIIFTTAYSQYALEGYEFNAIDYLLKPISLERFLQAVTKATYRFNFKNKKQHLILKEGTSIVKIGVDAILYLCAMQNYVQIITPTRKYMILMTIKDALKLLPQYQFYRIHRSYIVNLKKIDEVITDVVMIGTFSIPISKRVKNDFLEKFERFG
ncbi:MAG: LytR/AlgR family response regulator transcription factor [Croceivirga sp.]